MKCANCGNNLLASDTRCDRCDELIIHCDVCKELILESDVFCGNCGCNVEKTIERVHKQIQKELEEFLEKEKLKKQEKEIKEYSENLIVECEGNKFKAIKLLKEKFNIENQIASDYINLAFSKFESDSKQQNDNIQVDKDIGNSITSVSNSNEKGIKKTIIVANSSRKKATSAIGRGLIGGALLGPIGLLAGTTAKTKDTTTFLVIYNNGKQETVTVKNGGWQFNEYCKYLEK